VRYSAAQYTHFIITPNVTKYDKYRLMSVMVMKMMTNLSTLLNPTIFKSKGRSAECNRPLTWTAEDADGQ
jgi:hypothetical protein